MKTGKSSKKPNLTTPLPPPQPIQPSIQITDLLDTLLSDACVQLTRRLLTAVPKFPSEAVRSQAVLKIVVLFVAEYGSTA
jgi:hypothetical protein